MNPTSHMNLFSKMAQNMGKKRRVYLDYASLTPVDERVMKEMIRVMRAYPANPSSLYAEGVAAEKFLNEKRNEVAKFFEGHSDEIIFTSGGTEANNLAIKGVIRKAIENGISKPHVISLAIEHPSVREILSHFEKNKKCEVTYVPVDKDGIIDLKEFKAALRSETVLVTIMYANNEIGVIQPIADIAKAIRAFKKNQFEKNEMPKSDFDKGAYPIFHTDACQAAAYESMRVPALGVDMVTIDGGKVYGPRGIGALYIKRGVQEYIVPEMLGGGQENDFRAGTENLPSIAGLAMALNICVKEKEKEAMLLSEMRDWLIDEIKKISPTATLNGHGKNRLPNNVNMCFEGQDAEFLVLRLDAKGICVSSVTSCRSKSEDSTSYVIEELQKAVEIEGGRKSCAAASLRITLGRFTTKSDLNSFLKILKTLKI